MIGKDIRKVVEKMRSLLEENGEVLLKSKTGKYKKVLQLVRIQGENYLACSFRYSSKTDVGLDEFNTIITVRFLQSLGYKIIK